MPTDLAATRAALEHVIDATTLRDGPGGTLVVDGLPPDAWFATWEAVRGLTATTGRHPVATTRWVLDSMPGWVDDSPPGDDIDDPSPADVEAFRRDVEAAQPWATFDLQQPDYEIERDEVASYLPEQAAQHLAAAAVAELTLPVPLWKLWRWVHDRLQQEPHLVADQDYAWTVAERRWFTPDNVSLVLLPTTDSWMAGRWLSFFGALDRAPELAAAEQEWHTRWGAERVASWGTMIQHVVPNPPTSAEDTWTTAMQLLAVAWNNEEHAWMLARALPHGHHWFLHSRP